MGFGGPALSWNMLFDIGLGGVMHLTQRIKIKEMYDKLNVIGSLILCNYR